jgi:O-antigen/teichoic acid export membrane protein
MKWQLLFSLTVQVYLVWLGLLLLPIYLSLLGKEAFGLIGLFLLMQTMLQLLDLGFTQALSREMTRFRAGGLEATAAAQRLRTLEWLFAGIGSVFIILVIVFNDVLIKEWLKAESLSQETLAFCLSVMVMAVVLRFLSGLYRGVLTGLEKQSWLNSLSAIFVTLRFAVVLLVLFFISATPEAFFIFQLFAASAEVITYYFFTRRLIPSPRSPWPSLSALKALWPIVGSMTFLNILWILLTNLDKFLFSGLLTLAEYGQFTLAVSLAATVLILLLPFNQVVQPRLTYLFARGDQETFSKLYQIVSQATVVLFISVGGTLAFFAESVLALWTGDAALAATAAPIVFWYALANVLSGIALPPFMLQFAQGRLRLHLFASSVSAAVTFPAVIVAALWVGPVAVGQVLVVVNLLFVVFWLPVVHRQFLPALIWQWSWQNLSLALLLIFWLWLAQQFLFRNLEGLGTIFIVGFLALLFGVLLSKSLRPFLYRLFFPPKKTSSK